MRDLSVCGMKSRSKMCRETEEIHGDGSGGGPEEGSKMGGGSLREYSQYKIKHIEKL